MTEKVEKTDEIEQELESHVAAVIKYALIRDKKQNEKIEKRQHQTQQCKYSQTT